jgi:hypothetical protein
MEYAEATEKVPVARRDGAQQAVAWVELAAERRARLDSWFMDFSYQTREKGRWR